MRNVFLISTILASLVLVGCSKGQSSFGPIASAEAAVPSFLQVGKKYEVYGEEPITVLEIDSNAGWVKVEGDNFRGGYWKNLAHVRAMQEVN